MLLLFCRIGGLVLNLRKYRRKGEIMYTEVYMDILNKCNARCFYCKTGQSNLTGRSKKVPAYYMDVKAFDKLAVHMRKYKIITEDCLFRIYNWYEPTLNPHLPEIVNYMYDEGLRIDMSTNAGQVPDFSRIRTCTHYDGMLFSMPGFSQQSYDRIHGFSFEKVKENIRETMECLRERGFQGDAYINYHLYQFNIGEIYAAKEFADELGIRLHSIFAYFNGTRGFHEYATQTMSREMMTRASKDLFFYFVKDLQAEEEKYRELFREPPSITLSEFCNILPGRGSNDEDAVASIFDMKSCEEVEKLYESLRREKDPDFEKIRLWPMSYKLNQNILFDL